MFYVQVWEMEWDMSGMTLATTGSDGMVRLWQSNLNGEWHEQAMLEPVPSWRFRAHLFRVLFDDSYLPMWVKGS